MCNLQSAIKMTDMKRRGGKRDKDTRDIASKSLVIGIMGKKFGVSKARILVSDCVRKMGENPDMALKAHWICGQYVEWMLGKSK